MAEKTTVKRAKKVTRADKAGTSKQAAVDRKKLFAEAYIANGGNASEAAKNAGYSAKTAYSAGYRLKSSRFLMKGKKPSQISTS